MPYRKSSAQPHHWLKAGNQVSRPVISAMPDIPWQAGMISIRQFQAQTILSAIAESVSLAYESSADEE